MKTSYTELKPPKILWETRAPSESTLSGETNVVFLVGRGQSVRDLPYGSVLRERIRRHRYSETATEPLVLDLPNGTGTRLALAFINEDEAPFATLTRARKLLAPHKDAPRLYVAWFGPSRRAGAPAIKAIIRAALSERGQLPDFRHAPPPGGSRLDSLRVWGPDISGEMKRLVAEARGNHLARYLTALPADRLTPAIYRAEAARVARAHGWKSQFFGERRLAARGAGAFLAVSRGSQDHDAGILRLSYRPKGKPVAKLALVGKGICFDTGGVNVKGARHMYGMHEDMEGSAVALGTLLALTELKVPFAVDAWLALARNDIGPRAYRPNEVVTALNGTTIETVHTDAEGRMVLADTLSLACGTRPKLVIDYATLTGACVYALGTAYSGAFTNRPAWAERIVQAGYDSGERVWPFPMDDDYADALKSDVADVKQCVLEGEADHILAALFLRRFLIGDPAWIHLDLSAGRHKGGLAHIPTDVTGFGVHFTLRLVLDHDLLASPGARPD
ncbi:MAG: M17 family metallopeptidase [Acidiferrobacteraceae bacterium]